jgi:methionyl-tRNA synthetase
MTDRYLVTSALPYANGSIHLGHLVEYIQTDVYVRFRRLTGASVTYVCAADSHGTPIEVNAAKAGIDPRLFVEKYRAEQHEDFRRFGVEFSTYYTTDSPENRVWAHRIYRALKAKGLIYRKSIEQLFCEHDGRFLPDRFVKGKCPGCGAADQYGDVCESCGKTYDPRELGAPYCSLCGRTPVVRTSEHAYVNLKKVEPLIREWVEGEGHLEPSVREQVKGWLDDLQDWCITRDAPYFGFELDDPDFPGKYLYVWMDAPIGYLSSAEHYFAEEAPPAARLLPEAFEKAYLAESSGARLEHFIGKDILRFHAVFWPAMLWAAGVRRPDRMAVHGHLVVNGEKMSKSRGTFITARTYLDSGLDPELLRYYYAAKLSPGMNDLNLDLDDFRTRINADLANNLGNLASRVATLLPRAGAWEGKPDGEVAAALLAALSGARAAYERLEYGDAVRHAMDAADACNKKIQDGKPWEEPASEASRKLLASCAHALCGIAVLLSPVMPRFCAGLLDAFGHSLPDEWDLEYHPFGAKPPETVAKPPRVDRLEARQVARLVATPPPAPPPAPAAAPAKGKAAAPKEAPKEAAEGVAVIGYEDFAKVELKVAVILKASKVEGADRLLHLHVDAGEVHHRTIVAGIAQAYPEPEALKGRRIVIVANLAPRKLRGIESQGMLLAAGEPPDLQVVTVGEEIAPGTKVK